ncbi:MAG: TRAP transporter small permease [Tropicimonas sp.]|uniref:TRAP transporter small permease n=1 Tax=Tropicimonas sp. TaxID=2067044 RepID=UPI003A8B6E4C
MEKYLTGAARALKAVLGVCLVGLVLISCLNVLLRHVFEISWIAADEIQVFIMIGIAFLGTIVVSAERMSLSIEILGPMTTAPVRAVIDLLKSVVTVLVCGFVTVQSWAVLDRIFQMGQRGGSSGIPMWIPHASITICFGALTLIGLLHLLGQLAGHKRPGRPS